MSDEPLTPNEIIELSESIERLFATLARDGETIDKLTAELAAERERADKAEAEVKLAVTANRGTMGGTSFNR